ncbi:hypothetical protein [Streptomyces sp. MN13]
MIEPESIPLFTGDLGQLDHHIAALQREAVGIRDAGDMAHRQFQGLSAFYEAPEAEDLFASTAPARDAADAFAGKVEKVAEALSTYAAEVAPIAKQLEQLKSRATTFVAGLRTESGEFDEKWNKDADKVAEHQALMHEVHAAQEAFWTAELACHNRITALVGGTQYVLNTGDKQLIPRGAHLYGYSAKVLDQAKELPWGTPVAEHHDWWDPQDFGYYFKSFVWDGLIVDNVWGTVDGLFSLTGINGSQEFKDSWTGLVRVLVGAETYLMEGASGQKATTGPLATDFAQNSKPYAKDFAKALVAWDQWDENPSRAAATVVFNTVTLGAGPLKAASAGRAGTAAKAATTVAKVGDAIDPISAAAKVTGHAIPKIAEVTASLRGAGDLAAVRGPHSVLELTDGAGRSVAVIQDGRLVRLDDMGRPISDTPLREPSAGERAAEAGSARQEQLVGAGATARLGEPEGMAGQGASPRDASAAGGDTESSAGHHYESSGGEHTVTQSTASGTAAAGGGGLDGPQHEPPRGGDGPSGWERPNGGHQPMQRGSELEEQVRQQLRATKVKPDDLERVLDNLANTSAGREVADAIATGRFNDALGYRALLSNMSGQNMLSGSIEQLRLANRLYESGIRDIAFEVKEGVEIKPGVVVAEGTDLDVMARTADGTVHGYQFKEVQNPKKIVQKMFSNMQQLENSGADFKTFVVDTKGTLADLAALRTEQRLTDVYGERNVQFIIRVEDGVLRIPPDGTFMPEGTL